MAPWIMHALMHAGLALKKQFEGGAGRGPSCQNCSGSLAGGSLTFDRCCGIVVCPSCAGQFLTPLGGGEYLVECRCGAVRRARFH